MFESLRLSHSGLNAENSKFGRHFKTKALPHVMILPPVNIIQK